MSENYRYYKEKMADRRAARRGGSPGLRRQLDELFTTAARCEAMWALEDRIARNR